jgi:hypothetical protein
MTLAHPTSSHLIHRNKHILNVGRKAEVVQGPVSSGTRMSATERVFDFSLVLLTKFLPLGRASFSFNQESSFCFLGELMFALFSEVIL